MLDMFLLATVQLQLLTIPAAVSASLVMVAVPPIKSVQAPTLMVVVSLRSHVNAGFVGSMPLALTVPALLSTHATSILLVFVPTLLIFAIGIV
mmetsp:Transcript_10083/g.30952  ORF Transcript_10083/g.30952 Transcript_10083/m.30952 type:complete len:93 (+) Transcript_10083:224-502(+)